MSQSPDDTAEQTSVDQLVKYRNGWSALSQLIGKGRSFSGYERNCCFLNLGDGRFVDTSATTDLDLIDDGRAVALTDWNFDGAVDLWVANRTAPRVRFLQNQTDSTHPWLAIRLQGVTCNRDAIGARVEVHRPDSLPTLIKTLHAGDGYLSQSTKWIHFGLGQSERIAKVVVRWPGAKSQTFTGIRSNRHYRIVQGTKSATQLPVKTRSPLKPSPIDLPKPEASSRTWVQGRLLIPKSEYQTFDQQPASIDAFLGTPLLLNLWSANCQPCLTELNDWAHEFAFDRLQVLALSIDHFELDRSQAIQRSTTVLKSANAKSKGAKISGGLATERLIENLEAVQRTYLELQQPLPIPSSFLLDQRGQIAAIYKGPVTANQIKQDLKLLNVPKQKQRMAAVPFPGKFASQPFPALPMAIAKTLDSPQDPKRADDYLLRYVSRLCDDFSAKQRTLTTEENNSLASVIQTLIERLQSRGQLDRIDGTLKRLLTVASGNAALHRSIATALVRKGIASERCHILKQPFPPTKTTRPF